MKNLSNIVLAVMDDLLDDMGDDACPGVFITSMLNNFRWLASDLSVMTRRNDITKAINRHKARTLAELEDGGCKPEHVLMVKNAFVRVRNEALSWD